MTFRENQEMKSEASLAVSNHFWGICDGGAEALVGTPQPAFWGIQGSKEHKLPPRED